MRTTSQATDALPSSTAFPSPSSRSLNRTIRSMQSRTVRSCTSVSTPRPPTTARVVELNRGPFVGAPAPLEERQVAQSHEVTVLDVRSADAHASGHLHGAFNVPVSGSAFATRAGFLLDPDER